MNDTNTQNAGPGLDEFVLPGEEDIVVIEEAAGGLQLLDSGSALSAVERANIDVQITTAKRYPRQITTAIREAQSMACVDAKTAETMTYALKRGKGRDAKIIEGPSVRLAEIMAYAWGNMRIDSQIVAEDKTHITAQGTCFDLQKNIATRVQVKRRITDKNGKRYNDDMIGVTGNAAISIALRNAVFKVIPFSLTSRVYLAARAAMLGQGTLKEKRANAMEHFAKLGVKPDEIYALLDVKGEDDVLEDQLVTLRGFANAIKEGEMTVESVFRSDVEQTSSGTDEINAALAAKKKGASATKAASKADCEACGVKAGQPHKDACPYAD